MEPQVAAACRRALGHAEIAVGHDPGFIGANDHLSRLSHRQRLVIVVENADLEMRQNESAFVIPLRRHHPARVNRAIAAAGDQMGVETSVEFFFGTGAGVDQQRVILWDFSKSLGGLVQRSCCTEPSIMNQVTP